MAKHREAKAAIRLIERNIETLVASCLDNQGMIYEGDLDAKQIEDLLANRIAIRLDENDNYIQAYRPITELLAHVTQSSRRRISHAEVDAIFNDLKHNANGYFIASAEGNRHDKDQYEISFKTNIADLIDSLRTAISRFAGYIRNEFSMVSSLSQRIRENSKAIKEAENLVSLFSTMTPSDLSDIAQNNYVITRSMLTLSSEIRDRGKELNDVLHRLRENQVKFESDKKYQQKNELIDAMLQHYQLNPTYQPTIQTHKHERFPPWLDAISPTRIKAHPPIDNEIERRKLEEFACAALDRVKATSRPKHQAFENTPVEVVDHSKQVRIEKQRPEDAALDNLFNILPELIKQGVVSSMECYKLLGLNVEPRAWVIKVINRYHNSKFASDKSIRMRYIKIDGEGSNEVSKVYDVMFERLYA